MLARLSLLTRLALIALLLLSASAGMSCKSGSKKYGPAGTVNPDVDPLGNKGGASSIPEGGLKEVRPLGAGEYSSELKIIYFEYDSAKLSPEAIAMIEANAKWIKAHSGVTVQIEGHCDERGSVEYNTNLGQRRASSVREHLARLGVDPGRMTTISYGKERPVDPASNEGAWKKNRRVQFLVY